MWFAAFITASAAVLSGAARSSLRKPQHEALIVTAASEEEQLSTHAGIAERMTHLASQTNQLVSFINEVETGLGGALLQLQSLTEPKSANATKKAAPVATKNATNASKAAPAAAKKTEPKSANATKVAPAVNLKALSKDEFKKQVKEESDVLANLFKHLKVNIAHFNKEESHDKDKTEDIRKRLEARFNKDKATLAMKNISDFEKERLTNATRMESHELEYWNRDRDLQHHMFHSNLKMTHGLMSRVKTVMEAYQQAFAKGKISANLMKNIHEMSPTKAAFLEMRKDVKERAHLYKVHLRLGMQISHPPHREAGSII